MDDPFDVRDIPAAQGRKQQDPPSADQARQVGTPAASPGRQDSCRPDYWRLLAVFAKGCMYVSAKVLIVIISVMVVLAGAFIVWTLLLHVLLLLKQAIGM